jgi:acyl carrier protein
MNTRESIQKIVADQLGCELARIVDDAAFVDDLGADSLAMVGLVQVFEEEFQIDIPEEHMEGIRTVGDAIAYVDQQLARKGGAVAASART